MHALDVGKAELLIQLENILRHGALARGDGW